VPQESPSLSLLRPTRLAVASAAAATYRRMARGVVAESPVVAPFFYKTN